ncbi:MAG: penicillin-binding protein 2 [Bdellovibrionales bacterium]|jgi:penicillin-binding protein 2|nr:penicillin-binding protein 2 [Bdellovibrionales bacterium]
MNRDMERYKEFSRRALLVGAGQAALFAALAGRLGFLQVIEQEKFQMLSDRNRISMRLVPAGRGEIMDRFGVPLAINTQNFRAFIVPEQTDDVEKTLDKLARLIPVTEEDKQEVLVQMARHRRFTPLLVKENLTWDDMAQVELNLPDLPGVSIDEGEIRSYPFGPATSHIIGYVGRVSKAELTDDPVMSLPGFRIGKNGVEKSFDETLRGAAGQVQAEVNVVGREIRELKRTDAKQGHRLTLTLDADLQMQCQEMLTRHRSASAVVMDAHNGEVYALCSHPGFDPNLFSRGIPADIWEELLADDTHPLTNKAVSGQYPPGSTFKMVTQLAAFEAGISPGMRVFCPGFYMLGNHKFHCWKQGGHGHVDAVQAMAQSCDCYYYEVGKRIGVDAIAKMARRLGLGERLGFDIPNEGPGLMPDRAWKLRRHREQWQQGETLNTSIGQGHVLATPLQLATMTARLVNGGRAVKPLLVRTIEDEGSQLKNWPSLGLDPNHLAIVIRGMNAVVNEPRGTALGARITEAGYSMGGKTGTAQVRAITAAQRAAGVKNEDLPWRQRHHALFVGYGPITDPRYVVSVVVEHGVGGSKAAAPLARDILLATQKRDPKKIHTVDEAIEAAVREKEQREKLRREAPGPKKPPSSPRARKEG